MKKNKIFFIIAATMVLFVVSCFNSINKPEGMGLVQIHIAGTDARTFLPDLGDLRYHVSIARVDETTPVVNEFLDNGERNWNGVLPLGQYVITVEGYQSGITAPVASGYQEMFVETDIIKNVTITVYLLQNTEGTLAYTINISESVQFAGGELIIESLSEELEALIIPLTEDNLSGNISLAAGYYQTTLYVTNSLGNNKSIYRTVIIAHISGNLITPASYHVNEDYFYNSGFYLVTSVGELNAALSQIQTESGDTFIIRVKNQGLSANPIILDSNRFSGKTITILGDDGDEIRLNGSGSLFTIESGVCLKLESITLRGSFSNNAPLVKVNPGGKLVLGFNGTITGNYYTIYYYSIDGPINGGAGVYVDGGTLEIAGAGGTISSNEMINNTMPCDIFGGGVAAVNGSTVIMSGGVITYNSCKSSVHQYGGAYGGGVYIDGTSSFEKTGGVIYGNDVYDYWQNWVNSSTPDLSGGYAVFYQNASNGGLPLWRNSTVRETDNLNSAVFGEAGGWDMPVYTVTFNSNGGSAVNPQNVTYASLATRPENPSISGNQNYNTFIGWYSDPGFAVEYDFSVPVTGNITLYARWGLFQHTVTFVTNGGSALAPQRVGNGETLSISGVSLREGYALEGWYTDSELSEAYKSGTQVFADMVLYAKWYPLAPITIAIGSGLSEWDLVDQSAQVTMNVNHVFIVEGNYTAYEWYLDGVLVGRESAYNFNKAIPGVYELAVLVSNSAGERRSGSCRVTVLTEGPSSQITIKLGMEEWALLDQTAQIDANTDYVFTIDGADYKAYEWYLDGVPVGTASSTYTFNKTAGSYELAVVVTNNAGEKRSASCRVRAL